jgi:hypothetical protein
MMKCERPNTARPMYAELCSITLTVFGFHWGRPVRVGIQAPTNLAQADPIEADPGEHQPDQARFLLDHLDPRHPAALILGDVGDRQKIGGAVVGRV